MVTLPDIYFKNQKYAIRGKGGRFVKADSHEAQVYIFSLLDETARNIEIQLYTKCQAGADNWVRTHLTPAGMPYDTGNLLASTGVVVSNFGTGKKTFQGGRYDGSGGLTTRSREYKKSSYKVPWDIDDKTGKWRMPEFSRRKGGLIPQHWRIPQPGKGFGKTYWRAAVNSDLGVRRHHKDRGVTVSLISAIPYAGPLNLGEAGWGHHTGWYTQLVTSLAKTIMHYTQIKGYHDADLYSTISAIGKESGGLLSSIKYG